VADQVVARVKQVRGDIVADDSYFVPARFPGWTVDDTVWVMARRYRQSRCTIIRWNWGAARRFRRRAGADHMGPAPIRCRTKRVRWQRAPDAMLSLARDPESRVSFWAAMRSTPDRALPLAVPGPAEWTAAQLKRLLEARGVQVTGRSRAQHGRYGPATEGSGRERFSLSGARRH
jgi:hypothetical protein